MELLIELNRWTHIVFGFTGLAAFWVPVFAAKGSSLHRVAGKVFRWSAMIVLAGAGLAVVLRGLHAYGRGVGVAENLVAWSFLVFLGYLALVTGAMLSHGIGVLRHKRDLGAMNTLYRRGTAYAAMAASVAIIGWALYWQPGNAIVLYALSPLGIVVGLDTLRVIRAKKREPELWKLEHLGAMLGCGIAFHTAFAVFGANQLFAYQLGGVWMAVPWVLPIAVGLPAIALWTRHYRNQHRLRAGASA